MLFSKEPLSVTLTFRCTESEKQRLDAAVATTGKGAIVDILREALDLWFAQHPAKNLLTEKPAKSAAKSKRGR